MRQRPGQRINALDRNAHEARSRGVFHRRLHGDTQPREAEERKQQGGQRGAHGHDAQVDARNDHAPDVDGRGREDAGQLLRILAPHPDGQVTKHQEQAQRANGRRQQRLANEAADDEPLDRHAQRCAKEQRERHHRPQRQTQLEQGVGHKGREHGRLTMREVEDARRLEHHHDAQGDEPVDGAQGDAAHDHLQHTEPLRVTLRLQQHARVPAGP